MAHLAQLANLANLGTARLAAANTARDGSGTVVTLWTCPGRVSKVANLSAATVVTVTNWSKMSNDSNGNLKNGDVVNLIAGTSLTNIALNTDYVISNLGVDSSDNATFQLLDSSNSLLTMTATNPVFQFPSGGRGELVRYTPSPATPAAVAAKIVSLFYKPRNGSYKHIGEITVTAHTPSSTVACSVFDLVLAYPFQAGDSFGVIQSVYGSGVDQGDVIFFGSQF